MMEAAHTSETSVDNYFTRQYIPEDNSELHTRRRENLKSHTKNVPAGQTPTGKLQTSTLRKVGTWVSRKLIKGPFLQNSY
jgi:hypothetical protein